MIDYVVPMVFNDDPLWQSDFARAGGRYDESNPYDFVRYRSWGLEHLLIRCVKKFMPWVRTIYVILARKSQWKEWMDEEGVRVVYHEDFIPKKHLPVFNSRAIEMFLKDIPNLSEQFLYGNDDMFPLAPMQEWDFFSGGLPCLQHTEHEIPEHPNNFHLACLNGLNFIGRDFGVEFKGTILKDGHCITPMLKSTWEYLWDKYGEEIDRSVTAFREPCNFNQWLCPWWHHLSGKYVDKAPARVYVSIKKNVDEVVKVIKEARGIVCINDNECEKDYMKYGRAVKKAIENKLNS